MRSIEQQRNVELRPGFSPRPLAVAGTDTESSPSHEPETTSPNALLDGPLIQAGDLKAQSAADIMVQNGIVDFGK
jgi:hypothetical protein